MRQYRIAETSEALVCLFQVSPLFPQCRLWRRKNEWFFKRDGVIEFRLKPVVQRHRHRISRGLDELNPAMDSLAVSVDQFYFRRPAIPKHEIRKYQQLV